jgi:subtilase family serine protease
MKLHVQRQSNKAASGCVYGSLAAVAVVGILASTVATAAPAGVAVPYTTATTPKAVDLGAYEAQSPNTPLSLTIALRLTDLDAAEKLLQSVSTPGDPQYRQFLTPAQFAAPFAPTNGVSWQQMAEFSSAQP